eukprot:2962229-Rhodomonas_salina.1
MSELMLERAGWGGVPYAVFTAAWYETCRKHVSTTRDIFDAICQYRTLSDSSSTSLSSYYQYRLPHCIVAQYRLRQYWTPQ